VTSDALSGRRLRLAKTFRLTGLAGSVARTAGFNVGAMGAAGIAGIVLARALGPTERGEYAAITSWFGVVLMVGGMGQPAALCYYVARQPERAREYVATSRAMMLTTGIIALTGGLLLAPLLAHGNATVTLGYRIAFGASIAAPIGASYTFSLQARDLRRWNVLRLAQPVASMIAVIVLWRLRLLSLNVALIIITVTMALQMLWAYTNCRRVGLAPGHARIELIRPLFVYGAAQIAAATPALLNADLDQLILSQTVPAPDLGRYAIAVTLTQLPIPVVSAIGNVAFPRLASQQGTTAATLRLQRRALLGSAGLAVAMLVPLAVLAPWFVPLVFGAAYRGAVPLMWILTPGTVFLSCGQVVGDLLRGRSHPSTVAWAQGFAAIFTVALLFALLPVVGVSGAAIASTVAYGVAFFVMLRRLIHLPRHARGSGPRDTSSPKGSRRRATKEA
jgi:O-antigen/teichoic acid export membrane protein